MAPLESHTRHVSALQREQQRVALDAALDHHAQVRGDTTPATSRERIHVHNSQCVKSRVHPSISHAHFSSTSSPPHKEFYTLTDYRRDAHRRCGRRCWLD